MRVIVSAGGTGGHIYPALAIINKIKEMDKNSEFLYIGTTDRMEKEIVPALKIPYVAIEMKGLNRKQLLKNGKSITCFFKAIKKAKEVVKEFKPDIVIGTGGYITAPVIYAAHKEKIPTFIHEQNSLPGLSNRFLAFYATKIGVSLEDSMKYFDPKKAVFTGNPRSEEIANIKKVSLKKWDLSDDKKLVLIVMGSLGSKTMTEKMKELIPSFKYKRYQVLIVTGKNYFDEYKDIKVPKNVKLVPYLNDLIQIMKSTTLFVSRAGASSISEFTSIALPTILIPSPYVTNNHQLKNAQVLEQKGASKIILEEDFSKDTLIPLIDSILSDEKLYKSMKESTNKLAVKDSASKIYELIKKIVEENKNEQSSN